MWQYRCKTCGYTIEWVPYASWKHVNRDLDNDHYPVPTPIEGTDAWRIWEAKGWLPKEEAGNNCGG